MNLTKKHEKNPCFITKTEYLPYCVAKLMMKCLPASKLSIAFSDTDQMLHFCLPNYFFLEMSKFQLYFLFFSNKVYKFYTGDYVCHKIGHEVLSNKPARVTLVTSASGCTGHSYVTSLNSRLCCIGRTLSWRAIECHRAALHRDSLFG